MRGPAPHPAPGPHRGGGMKTTASTRTAFFPIDPASRIVDLPGNMDLILGRLNYAEPKHLGGQAQGIACGL